MLRGEQSIRMQMEAYVRELKDKKLEIEGQYVVVKRKIFGKSSEKSTKEDKNKESQKSDEEKSNDKDTDGGKSTDKKSDQSHKSSSKDSPKPKPVAKPKKLSERYKNLETVEEHIKLEDPGTCSCCSGPMVESGLIEESESLTVIPKRYYIKLTKRYKYRCSHCHDKLICCPAPKKIVPGGSYSDALIIDVALCKYCDLVPVERYCSMASRAGLDGLPQSSLITQIHRLAQFCLPIYERIFLQTLMAKVLYADETPHRMLEGSTKTNWQLWGFSTDQTAYFECHDTRSAEVASNILSQANCEFLGSDVYSGYSKAVKDSNIEREQQGAPLITNFYCNAHSRRKFKEAQLNFGEDAEFFIDRYRKVYNLYKNYRDELETEEKLKTLFDEMKARAKELLVQYSAKSMIAKACAYLINNFHGLTLFINHKELDIDNNRQERLLRNPVIGRKTWYGTHSEQGARTTAIMFTIVETCKLNKINPRYYLSDQIDRLHQNLAPEPPWDYVTTV